MEISIVDLSLCHKARGLLLPEHSNRHNKMILTDHTFLRLAFPKLAPRGQQPTAPFHLSSPTWHVSLLPGCLLEPRFSSWSLVSRLRIKTVFSLVSLFASLIYRPQLLNIEMCKEKDFSSPTLLNGIYSTIYAKYPRARTVYWSMDDSVKQDSFVGLLLFLFLFYLVWYNFFSRYFSKLFVWLWISGYMGRFLCISYFELAHSLSLIKLFLIKWK